jgi:hypothetical protein
MHRSLKRRNPQVDVFSNHERDVFSVGIGVALLPALGYPQVLSNLRHIFLSFDYGGGTEEGSLPHLRPHQRRLTLSALKSFEGCHLQTGLVAVVVRELSVEQTLLPIRSVGQHTSFQKILKYLVHSLCLPICLWVEGGTVVQVGAHGLMQTPPELGGKLYPLSDTMLFDAPCSFKMLSMYRSTSLCVSKVVFTGTKCATLVNRSTITQIESLPFCVRGRPTIKSMLISSHFHVGISSG